jgi:hypothetical protein
MKILFLIFISAIFNIASMAQGVPKTMPRHPYWPNDAVPENCMIKGKSMNARVRILSNNADFKVRLIHPDEREDLTVRFITNTRGSTECGQWELVNSREDFTVEFVKDNEDFTIRVIEGFGIVRVWLSVFIY